MFFWNWLMLILRDIRGEDDPGSGGQGGSGEGAGGGHGDPGEGDPGAGEGEGEGAGGEGEQKPPAFGDFGDTPKNMEEASALISKIFEAHGKVNNDHTQLTERYTATQRNAETSNKALKSLESMGIKATRGEDGELHFDVENKKAKERPRRFTDDHKKNFLGYFDKDGDVFLDMVNSLVQDNIDDWYDGQQKEYKTRSAQQRATTAEYNKSTELTFKYFPMLDAKDDANGKPTNADFDEQFLTAVLQRVKEKGSGKPTDELMAALEVGAELGIIQQGQQKSRLDGVRIGQDGKRILRPVGSDKDKGGKKGKLSKEEYLKLTPDKRKEEDKKNLGL